MAELIWPPKKRRQAPMSLRKRVAIVTLLVVGLLPWVGSAIYWYPRLNPELPAIERAILAAGFWVFKLMAMLAIWAADSR